MSKTVSARISESKHDLLRERCNKKGCSVNDFVKASLEFALDGKTDFDFEDDNPSVIESVSLSEKRPSLTNENEAKFESHYDSHGHYYYWNSERKTWVCKLNPKNIRIIP